MNRADGVGLIDLKNLTIPLLTQVKFVEHRGGILISEFCNCPNYIFWKKRG